MIKIVTDSGSYLPPDFVSGRGIEVVPLKVHFGDDEVYDEITGISSRAFYERLKTKTVFPTTSQPPAGEFKAAYERAAQAGADHILVITLSGKLSGTFSSATTAATMLSGTPITLFDSLSLGLGVGLMVAAASDMALAGDELPRVMQRLEQMRRDMQILVMLDTLEYVRHGGRIGAASALIGQVLKFKPILSVTGGVLKPHHNVRTKRRAIQSLLDGARAAIPNLAAPVQLAAMHAAAEADMTMLVGQLTAMFGNIQRLMTGELGPAIGAHTGPGTVAVGICPIPPL
ncbi:MAG: DegV family protein [Anaerolineae bacterium]